MGLWQTRAERLRSLGAHSVLPAKRPVPPSEPLPKRASTPRQAQSGTTHKRRRGCRASTPAKPSNKVERTRGAIASTPAVRAKAPRTQRVSAPPPAHLGPTTLSSAMDEWAEHQRHAMNARWPDSFQRLERLFGRGLVCTTHYSGTGAAEMALAKISTRPGGVLFHSACDVDPTCQQVLLGHGLESRAEHVFGDLCARPPANIRAALEAALGRFQKRARRASTPALSQAFLQEAMQILSQWHLGREDRCYCARHARSCPAFPTTGGRYHLEVSGVNCQPWSCAGRRLGWLDDRSMPCLVLVRMILATEPDGVCLECTPEFDFAGLSGLLRGKYTGDHVIMSPTDFGLPVSRRRMYMFFDRHGATPHRSLSDMLPVSRRTVNLRPEAFLSAGPVQVQRYYREFMALVPRRRVAKVAGHGAAEHRVAPVPRRLATPPPAAMPMGDIRLTDVLHGGALSRYEGHRRQVTSTFGEFRGCCIVDINNTPEYRGGPSDARVPTIMRSSTLVAIFSCKASDRLVLPTELPAIHGLQLPGVAARLPSRKVRSLVGNSMHVVQVGCFLQFALAMRG